MKKDIFQRIAIQSGDITTVHAHAIVNAANSGLVGGGGVDGAIHRAAGPKLMAACRTLGGCPTGEARITKGYNLRAGFVIHTVGPIYKNRPDDPVLLASCYENSFNLALENRIRSIAFPAISCGVYGYPVKEACEIALGTTLKFLGKKEAVEKVIFVLFSKEYFDIYEKTLHGFLGKGENGF